MGSLVTKKFIVGEGFSPRGYSPGFWTCARSGKDASETAQEKSKADVLIFVMDRPKCERRISQKAADAKRVRVRPIGAVRGVPLHPEHGDDPANESPEAACIGHG
jgi:hypothetical protein